MLDQQMRGLLDEMIDGMVNDLPRQMALLRLGKASL